MPKSGARGRIYRMYEWGDEIYGKKKKKKKKKRKKNNKRRWAVGGGRQKYDMVYDGGKDHSLTGWKVHGSSVLRKHTVKKIIFFLMLARSSKDPWEVVLFE
jgi:hypothetical protein